MKFKQSDMEQRAFEEIKHAVAYDTLLAYLDFNKHFDMNTDAIDYQLGAVIIQNGKPIAFYIYIWTKTQTQYTVTEK